MKTLNDIELKVLKAVADNILLTTDGDFGYSDQIKVEGLTSNQIKGYLSQLVQKDMIFIYGSDKQTKMNEIGLISINYNVDDFDYFE